MPSSIATNTSAVQPVVEHSEGTNARLAIFAPGILNEQRSFEVEVTCALEREIALVDVALTLGGIENDQHTQSVCTIRLPVQQFVRTKYGIIAAIS